MKKDFIEKNYKYSQMTSMEKIQVSATLTFYSVLKAQGQDKHSTYYYNKPSVKKISYEGML